MPEVAWWDFRGLRNYDDIAALEDVTGEYNTSLPDDVMMDLRRAYISTVTYVDELIGQVLNELDDLGLEDNTIVSFFGDHGFNLGEHSEWTKNIIMERSSHAPLMVRIPGLTTEGVVTEELTEFVDLFPTLAEAAGLEIPALCPEDSRDIPVCREGESMIPLITDPADPNWKKRVFIEVFRYDNDTMGYSMRTDRYRYSEWVAFNDTTHIADWDTVHGVELYDHHEDTLEDVNLVDDPAYEEILEELSEQLRAGWREVTRK
jgi:iduronate 2-sulfatase